MRPAIVNVQFLLFIPGLRRCDTVKPNKPCFYCHLEYIFNTDNKKEICKNSEVILKLSGNSKYDFWYNKMMLVSSLSKLCVHIHPCTAVQHIHAHTRLDTCVVCST